MTNDIKAPKITLLVKHKHKMALGQKRFKRVGFHEKVLEIF